jgi:thiol-disulfide isomerase/thioredoxin
MLKKTECSDSSELEFSDDDEMIYRLREDRIEKLKKQSDKTANSQILHGNGLLGLISDEKELMTLATGVPRLVIHFYSPNFTRCQTMNKHLVSLAKKRTRAKFVYIEATNAPFMVVQMAVKILPCVVAIVDGEAVQILVGFENLNSKDGNDFETPELEKWLEKTGVLS